MEQKFVDFLEVLEEALEEGIDVDALVKRYKRLVDQHIKKKAAEATRGEGG